MSGRDELELVLGHAVRMFEPRRDPLRQGEADYELDRRTLERRRNKEEQRQCH